MGTSVTLEGTDNSSWIAGRIKSWSAENHLELMGSNLFQSYLHCM